MNNININNFLWQVELLMKQPLVSFDLNQQLYVLNLLQHFLLILNQSKSN